MQTTPINFLFVLTLLTLACSCGKKINEGADADTGKKPLKLERNLTLVVDEVVSLTTDYHVPENAMFKLPTELNARLGNAIGKKIEIFYNYTSSNQYEFRCTYSSTERDSKLALVNCVSSSGDEIFTSEHDIKEIWFPVDKGTRVKLKLINPPATKSKIFNPTVTRMNIESAYLVDWK